MNHLDEEQLVAFRFGDLVGAAEAAAIEEHLHECETCRVLLRQIDVTLSAASRLPVPERSEGYGAEVWARIQPRLERPSRTWWTGLLALVAPPRRLALAGGMAAVILAAFVVGRFWPQAPAPVPGTAARPSTETQASASGTRLREKVLLVAVGDHLERSQMALVELVNAADTPRVDISDEQARARDLVMENRLYRQTALETGETGVATVLDDLERVLVEIANSPSELPQADFERVRRRIEDQGLIFKVRVLGERVRERETRAGTEI